MIILGISKRILFLISGSCLLRACCYSHPNGPPNTCHILFLLFKDYIKTKNEQLYAAQQVHLPQLESTQCILNHKLKNK